MAIDAPRIAIVAGEPSGDTLGAGLVAALKRRYPNATFVGIAGPKMQAQGCQSLFDLEALSVMGLVEVLSSIRKLLGIRSSLIQQLLDNPPDIYIGVDAPDFNLGVEKRLKQQGIKTVHYVSPTVWAWREKRVFKIAKACDRVLALLPFEKAVFDRYNLPCTFVGHTMADAIPLEPDQQAARAQLGLAPQQSILALLPGSRGGEVNNLLPVFLQSAQLLAQTIPDLQVVIPIASPARMAQITEMLEAESVKLNIKLVDGQAQQVMIASDAVLLASGTATLEAMLCKKPMVVAYRLSAITHWMMQYLYKADYFALPNVLAGEEVIPELLQEDVNPETIVQHLAPMFTQDTQALQQRFLQLHQSLKHNADEQAAQAVAEVMEGSHD